MKRALIAHMDDNVATIVVEGKKDDIALIKDELIQCEVNLVEDIPIYHKFALKDIESGKEIVKYGEVIGLATEKITKGQFVHIHNVESLRGRGDKVGG